MEGLDLTKLMGGPSLVINTAIALNGIAVKLETLLDSGANAYAVINIRLAKDVAHRLGVPILPLPKKYNIKGFDNVQRSVACTYLRAHLTVDRRRLWNVPFVILDIGTHDLILGKHFYQEHKALIDVANSRLLWPDSCPQHLSVAKETVFLPEQIRKQRVNQQFQADVERRDALIDALDMGSPSVLPIPYFLT